VKSCPDFHLSEYYAQFMTSTVSAVSMTLLVNDQKIVTSHKHPLSQSDSDSVGSTWIYILVAVLVFLLMILALVVVIIVKNKRSKRHSSMYYYRFVVAWSYLNIDIIIYNCLLSIILLGSLWLLFYYFYYLLLVIYLI